MSPFGMRCIVMLAGLPVNSTQHWDQEQGQIDSRVGRVRESYFGGLLVLVPIT